MARFCVILVALLLSLRGAAEPGPETVSWMQVDLPPQSILDGELAGQGWSDQQMHALFPLVAGFDHRVLQGTLSRVWYEMAHRDGICFNGAARNAEREAFAVFTHRPILVPPYALIVRSTDVKRFQRFLDTEGLADLDKMMGEEALTGGYTAARDHYPAINRFVQNPIRSTPMEKAISTSQLFNLLHAGRLDFIFVEPVEAPYYRARFHIAEEFTVLPIKGSPPSIRGYIACSNGPTGRAVVARIDAVLREEAQWLAYMEPLRRWMDPRDFAFALSAKPEIGRSP
jgi:uncharacterized protein (TIGR02285 family)